MTVSRILVDQGTFYEGPRWHEGRWWVSDFYRRVVLSFDTDGNHIREELHVDAMPSGLGWTPDGSLLVVSMQDHRLLRRRSAGDVEVVASFGELCGGFANDMVVDAKGGPTSATPASTSWAGLLPRRPTWCGSTPTAPCRWRPRT